MAITIHPSAIVDAGAQIGDDTRIWHWVHVCGGARIGIKCSFGQGVFVGNVTIGNGVKVQNHVSIYDGVTIEDEVFCGPSMVFTNVFNPRSHVVRKNEYRQTLVKRRASIGANATVVCGTTIGECAFIGAGAVVTRDVANYAIMVGVPARRIGWMCACGIRLPSVLSPTCQACGASYQIEQECCVPWGPLGSKPAAPFSCNTTSPADLLHPSLTALRDLARKELGENYRYQPGEGSDRDILINEMELRAKHH